MIGISKLYCGTVESSDALRYNRESGKLPSQLLQFSKDKKPVIVWNVGRRCNLRCIHCYSHSKNIEYTDELSTAQAEVIIKDLADFGCPVILFSGGEPLMRKDIFHLAKCARAFGMRVVFSTNGTLITKKIAEQCKTIGVSYVGVSLDGLETVNDRFRGVKGSFQKALQGIRNCLDAGVKVGLRFTINRHNASDIPGIFDLIERENIPRVCFYHLVYSGRGQNIMDEDLGHDQTRRMVDLIIDRTADLHQRGIKKEVLTVDNHADGIYLYLRMKREGAPGAADVLKLLKMNGGNSSANGIGCISWDGEVYPDQFWRQLSLGNVRNRSFSTLWTDFSNPLLRSLRDRKALLKGKCGRCVWQDICNGNFRARAQALYGDMWAEDPACFLTEDEIANRVE
ncbi:12,18-didecarboxysiroheme deacetylase [Chitinispirillales bacterium ANBcel5]|uniref:12,18-didecarboxysiroheme deacetylase n=1 Tax=Cellulosispirillum alkaliphilum TaxID=3039283 RepID=UPI002A560AAF|nr:12,18-didecarboxysiroheme deacetylase [Chitinispirillales bacterium ANBcel5]